MYAYSTQCYSTTFGVQSHIYLCDKILQFDFPDTSMRKKNRDPAQHAFGYDPWKEILLD